MRVARSCAGLLLVAILAAVSCMAMPAAKQQKPPGSLSGIVIGPDDKPVPHARLTYQSSAGHGAHFARTDANGRFHITKLPADNYDVRASSKGIFSEWEKNVTVSPGRDTRITLQLMYTNKPLAAPSGP